MTLLTTSVAVAVGCLVAYKLAQAVYLGLYGPLSTLPGPWHTRFSGVRLFHALFTGEQLHYVHSLHQKYGSIVRTAPYKVAVDDLESYKEIHRVGSPYMKAPVYQLFRIGGPTGHDSLFASINPAFVGPRRKMFARGFSTNALRDQWQQLVTGKVVLAIQRMREISATQGCVDILKWMTLMAGDITTHVMFGDSFHTLESGETSDYIKSVEGAGMLSVIAIFFPAIVPVGKVFPVGKVRRVFSFSDIMLDTGRRAIAQARSSQHTSNVFDVILATAEKDDVELSDDEMATEAASFIFAGTDTTATSLTYLIWLLLRNPDARKALEDEIDTMNEPLTDERLAKLPVLDACIHEGLRLYSAAPGALRRAVPEGGATLAGFYIPADIEVSTQVWTSHRREDLFVRPEEFDLSRWTEPLKVSKEGKQAFAPFGGRSRLCVGMHFAMMQMRLAVFLFFKEFRNARLSASSTVKSMRPADQFIIKPVGGKCEVVL